MSLKSHYRCVRLLDVMSGSGMCLCLQLPRICALLVILMITGCSDDKADLVFQGGAIYTVDQNRSWAEALAVRDGRIVYVGDDVGSQAWIRPGTEVIDLQGKMVLPGFHDAHVHPKKGGANLRRLDLSAARTREEILKKIKEYAETHPKEEWIVGVSFPLVAFPDANPRKEDLDRIVPDRPVYLTEVDGHSVWLNTKALQMAGITKDTPDPKGAKIERDAVTGEPSGTLREPGQFKVRDLFEDQSLLTSFTDLHTGIEKASEVGITSLLDAIVTAKDQWIYKVANYFGFLNARVTLALWLDPGAGMSQLDDIISRYHKDTDFRLSTTSVKFIMDGVLTSKTGLLVDPYDGDSGNHGLSVFSADELKRMAIELDKHSFQLHLHAVGDGAARLALDAIEATQQVNGERDARHHIAHLDVIDPDDLPRFRALNVVANLQPYWGYHSDYVKASERLLGAERKRWIYPYASFVKSGAPIAAGSDWPITTLNPLDAIQVAITRKSLDGVDSEKAFYPEEALDMETMIAAYTIFGAYALHQEQVTGSLEMGKFADLIVLDKNLFRVPVDEIHKAKVLLTLLEGKVVFQMEGEF